MDTIATETMDTSASYNYKTKFQNTIEETLKQINSLNYLNPMRT